MAQNVRAVLSSSESQAFESSNNQGVFLGEFAETDTMSTLSTKDIAKIFNIPADIVRQIRHRAHVKQKSPHRFLTRDPEQETDGARSIHKDFWPQNYVTQGTS
jgi:hypothetical protein